MLKLLWSTLTALLFLTVTLTAQQPTQDPPLGQPQLPPLGGVYGWQSMPMICAPGNTIHNVLTAKGFVAVNMSLGRKDADPKGEPVFMVTYYISMDGNSTAATMNIPTSTDTCLLYVTHDFVINQN